MGIKVIGMSRPPEKCEACKSIHFERLNDGGLKCKECGLPHYYFGCHMDAPGRIEDPSLFALFANVIKEVKICHCVKVFFKFLWS